MNSGSIRKKLFCVLLFVFIPCAVSADFITLKVGTIGPKQTGAGMALELFNTVGLTLEKSLGTGIKTIGYFGGVMGDDLQMIQKAKIGQLDLLTPTLTALTTIDNRFDILTMAYLIENFGQFDYVMRKNAKYINNLFWEKGWVSLIILFSEGEHNLYTDKEYRTVEQLKENLKASNYTGGADESFFGALGISQLPVSTTEMYPTFKAGVSNGAILPSLFVLGMQLYSPLPYIVSPAIRISSAGIILTKRKWETFPWDLKAYFAFLQPHMYWLMMGMLRDMSKSFSQAMIKHGCKDIRLTPAELKSWKDRVIAYREAFIGDDKVRRDFYNRVVTALNEYNTGNPMERQMYEKSNQYVDTPDRFAALCKAAEEYYTTGSKKALIRLSDEKIIEKWRMLDAIEASELYYKTGNVSKLKEWMKSYYIDEFVEDLFTKHPDSVKRVFGDEKALRNRLSETIGTLRFFITKYTGYQRNGIENQKMDFNKEYLLKTNNK